MAITTRCPSCETVFRVTAQQLQAHSGQVRCGRCMTVFDGFRGLAMLPDPAAEMPAPPPAEPVDAAEPPTAAPPAADTPDFGLKPVQEALATASERFSATEAPPLASGDAAQESVAPAPPQDHTAVPAADTPDFELEPVQEEPATANEWFSATEARPPAGGDAPQESVAAAPPQDHAPIPAADTPDFGLEAVDEEPTPASDWFSATEAPPTPSGEVAQEAVVPEPPQHGTASPVGDFPHFELEPVDEEPAPERFGATEAAVPTIAERARVAPAVAFDADEGDAYLDTLPLPRRTWPWSIGGTLLMLVLLGQAAYYYRSNLAAQYPVLKPALVELCLLAGCRVPLPQRPRLINIEASDLQVVDPTRPGVIRLTATLRNHAGHDVGYPALDLVLTNTREHTLARRIFTPGEYLERGSDPNAGIPAKAEVTVGIDLDTGDLGAAGFRLDLLPMPGR